MKTFFIRTGTAIVFAAIMIGGILWNTYSFAGLMTLILVGSLVEYFKITASKKENNDTNWLVVFLLVFCYLFLFYLDNTGKGIDAFTIIIPAVAMLIFVIGLFLRSDNPFGDIGWNIIPVFWVLTPLVLATKIYLAFGGALMLAIFFLIWIFDSASYIFGSMMGKHKLFERISPKKTWEGLIGGAMITVAAAFFAEKIPQLSQLTKIWWVLLALVVIVAGTLGDLVESLLKRSLGIKDSGSIMPGHGGFLDRFDAFFFMIPFVSFLLWLMQFMAF